MRCPSNTCVASADECETGEGAGRVSKRAYMVAAHHTVMLFGDPFMRCCDTNARAFVSHFKAVVLLLESFSNLLCIAGTLSPIAYLSSELYRCIQNGEVLMIENEMSS